MIKNFIQTVPKLSFGLIVVAILTIGSNYLATQIGAPVVLISLVVGISLNRLSLKPKLIAGINFTSTKILYLSVALLGGRISFDDIASLGLKTVFITIFVVLCTIIFTVIASKIINCSTKSAILYGGTVSICGSSAAAAIGSAMVDNNKKPQSDNALSNNNSWVEKNTLFAIICANLLSSSALILYPVLAKSLGLNQFQTGVFLGMSIHNVGQVIGAASVVSDYTTNVATVVKLMRVSMLGLVVMGTAIYFSRAKGQATKNENTDKRLKKITLIPNFIIGFLLLALISYFKLLPEIVEQGLSSLSSPLLSAAIVAMGLKTRAGEIKKVGHKPLLLCLSSTVFIAGLSLFFALYVF